MMDISKFVPECTTCEIIMQCAEVLRDTVAALESDVQRRDAAIEWMVRGGYSMGHRVGEEGNVYSVSGSLGRWDEQHFIGTSLVAVDALLAAYDARKAATETEGDGTDG